MENTQGQAQGFGITTETKSSNTVGYDKGGIHKAFLTDVVFEEVGKDTKYQVLSFKFTDVEGIKKFTHSEFAIQATDTDYAKKLNGMNSRIKHIWEAFAAFPTTGIGVGATSFEDFFQKVAVAFNTSGENQTPIYKKKNGEKLIPFLNWIKVAFYNKKGNIGFPLSPNFIERIKEDGSNQTASKTLTWNNKYDHEKQPSAPTPGGIPPGVMGGGAVSEDVF